MNVLLTCHRCRENVSLAPSAVRVECDGRDDLAVYSCPLPGCGGESRRELLARELLALHRLGVSVPADRLVDAVRVDAAAELVERRVEQAARGGLESMLEALEHVRCPQDLISAWEREGRQR